MQLPKRRPQPSPPRLPFPDPGQAQPWTGLSPAQQQTCQELLSQLLLQVLRDPPAAAPSAERNKEHDG